LRVCGAQRCKEDYENGQENAFHVKSLVIELPNLDVT
jgi:hypothetical protein